jgi:exosortase
MRGTEQSTGRRADASGGGQAAGVVPWGPVVAAVLGLLWFYWFEQRYGGGRDQSALKWIWSAWNSENDFEHGPLFPLVIVGLIVHRWKSLRELAGAGDWRGLLPVLAGVLLFAAAYRTLQPRVAVGALPMLLWGGAWCLWGWPLAKALTFPLFFFWLAIPVPTFLQATNGLQIVATSLAHHGSGLFGVDTVVQGTEIASAAGKWEPLEIAKGCSGIRSLMALLMIAGAWAYVAPMALWKRVLLFFSAFPIAILGNALRLVSIFVIAEYGNAEWARSTWHDWSGLFLFYPISLFMLLCVHSLLEGGLPWKRRRLVATRRVVRAAAAPDVSGKEETP